MRERLTLNARDQQWIDVLARWREGALTVAEAGALLGTSERGVPRAAILPNVGLVTTRRGPGGPAAALASSFRL
jgi:hypothetical protein